MKKLKLVMVGNGMAGVRTLEELRKIAPDMYDITVFGAEPHPNYNRILLSPVLAGEMTIQDIILNPLSWYAEHHIRLYLNRKVVQIDRQRRVVVADDGPGLAEDQLEAVFDPFVRVETSRSRETGGTGLGLAIALEDARLHGGWLQAWGRPGEGARFRLTLPRRSGESITLAPLPLDPDEVSA